MSESSFVVSFTCDTTFRQLPEAPSRGKESIMGKQYNKMEKRRRRQRYLERLKDRAKSARKKASKTAKTAR